MITTVSKENTKIFYWNELRIKQWNIAPKSLYNSFDFIRHQNNNQDGPSK